MVLVCTQTQRGAFEAALDKVFCIYKENFKNEIKLFSIELYMFKGEDVSSDHFYDNLVLSSQYVAKATLHSSEIKWPLWAIQTSVTHRELEGI